MKISLANTYKSLDPFEQNDLPDLIILTGVNGSGKTQLLEGMAAPKIVRVYNNEGKELTKKKYVDSRTLAPNESAIVSWDQLKQGPQNAWNTYENYKKQKQRNSSRTFEKSVGDPNLRRIINEISISAGKDIDDLSSDDFFHYYPLVDRMSQAEIFHQSFSQIFKRYQIHREDNDLNEFRNQKYGNVRFLSEKEFVDTFGEAPWDFVNALLEEAALDYYIKAPNDQHRDAPFELKLINKISNQAIKFSDLSGGEKVLMSLALSLYNSQFDLDFPEVLLMDEPDAPLHPTMTHKFLSVIQNVFVKQKGVVVVVTTHSPSTVALSPEENLFKMNKTAPRLVKTSKDDALSTLTAGLPSLSIKYENRRQVFVESKYDVYLYERIYGLLGGKLEPEISLNFISSGVKGSGSCAQVTEVVKKLTEYGNDSVFGLIDWDKKNCPEIPLIVMGERSRYSIENYIFDPIAFAAFLIRETIVDKKLLGYEEEEAFFDVKGFDASRLKIVVANFLNEVKELFTIKDEECLSCHYISGHTIDIPKWYLHCNGHELEEKVKSKWPQLGRFHNEGDLKKAVVDRIYADIPSIISSDFLDAFSAIQRHN